MNASNYLPTGDDKLSQWLAHFAAVAQANLTTLNLTAADVQTLAADASDFDDDTQAARAAHQAALAATETRAASRKKAIAKARALVKRIQATPNVPDDIKTDLGITVSRPRRRKVPVYQPMGLSAVLQPDLSVLLKWERNGSAYGAAFEVERRLGADGAWLIVKTVTATRFVDSGVAPGVSATYRVTATRGHLTSQPSGEASIYPNAASAHKKAAHANAQAA